MLKKLMCPLPQCFSLPHADLNKEPQCLLFQDGILMRNWRPYNVPDHCNSVEQIIVPSGYRDFECGS